VWEGLQLVLRSPYLGGIALFLFFYSSSSTIVYFMQAEVVAAAETARNARIERFADIDLWVNISAVVMQLFVTARIMTRLGVAVALVILPLLTAIGFATLGAAPTMAVLIVFQVARRSVNYAVMRPARETLFTVLSTAEKYKAKSFLDTFVYRGGDAISAKIFDLMRAAGLGLTAIAGIAVPVALVWGSVGIYLGRKQKALAKEAE
jgi:AAA family ATP:ADP antiporter